MLLIWVKREQEYFCEEDWTTQIRLNRLEKFAFRRRVCRGVCRAVSSDGFAIVRPPMAAPCRMSRYRRIDAAAAAVTGSPFDSCTTSGNGREQRSFGKRIVGVRGRRGDCTGHRGLSMDTAARWSRRHRDMESGGTAHRRTGIAMFHRHGAPSDGFASARALR